MTYLDQYLCLPRIDPSPALLPGTLRHGGRRISARGDKFATASDTACCELTKAAIDDIITRGAIGTWRKLIQERR